MKGFLVSLSAAVVVFLAVTGEYISFRILLPDMGLTAPDWWAIFWANVFLVLFTGGPWFVIKVVADS